MGDNLKVQYKDMPHSVRAFTAKKDEFYTIYLNSRLSYEQNKESLVHELLHISNDDFDRDVLVDQLEYNYHEKGGKPWP